MSADVEVEGRVFPTEDNSIQYVAERSGTIHVAVEGTVQDEPLLDLSDRVVQEFWEQGFLGLSLHPNFESNRKLYVRYSGPNSEDTPEEYSHTAILSEYRVSEDLRSVKPESERTILTVPEPGQAHNGGDITFGPDGYLYVSLGDGGVKGDAPADSGVGHAEDWYGDLDGGNGQDVEENLLGSVLRIDVNREGKDRPYAVPQSNPLVGKPGMDEHYAWGFRNPFRMSFNDGRLFVGDVGTTLWEEINVVEKGGNYGWNVREGPDCFGGLSECPESTPDGAPLKSPVFAYSPEDIGVETGQIAVIGGYTYDNQRISGLKGMYVFANFGGKKGGRLFAGTPKQGGDSGSMKELQVASNDSGKLNEWILSFGRDNDGALYVLSTSYEDGGGSVYQMVPPK